MSGKNNPDGKVHYSHFPPGSKTGKFLALGGFSCFLNQKQKNRGEKVREKGRPYGEFCFHLFHKMRAP